MDARNFARGRTASVAAEFVSAQLRDMKADASESEAYDAASRWLVENGPAVLRKVDARLLGGGGVPAAAVPPADTFARVMGMQAELLREALAAEEAARAGRAERALPAHRTFLSADELAGLAARTAHRTAPRVGAAAVRHQARAGAEAAAEAAREAEADDVRAAVAESAEADAVAAAGAPAVADGSPPKPPRMR